MQTQKVGTVAVTANTEVPVPPDKVVPDPVLGELLSASEVASFLRIKKQTVARYARSGKLHGIKKGNTWVFTRDELRRALDDKLDELGG